MKSLSTYLTLLLFIWVTTCSAQQRVGKIIVPDVLTLQNGNRVTTVKQWREQRRPELISLFKQEMYGTSPGRPQAMTFHVFDVDRHALNGKATRKQITVLFNGKEDGPKMDILLYLPNHVKGKIPAVVGLNFNGNQAVSTDPGIRIDTNWMSNSKGVVNNHATEASRGSEAAQWPIETIISRGYAVATVYRGAIDPDFDDGFKNGVQALYPKLQNRGDNFATIAAWAWGLSRALDYLETDKAIDAKKVAVFGFSRLGKAALWAGATDERFSLVISNESGAGGAKLFHFTRGEDIARLNSHFPHWFDQNFKKYTGQDTLLPFDQHMVIALVAPRPIYVASAIEDSNSNPEAEFWGLKAAEPVYQLYGKQPLPANSFPAVNAPVKAYNAYHVRTGKHNVTPFDWEQYLSFMDEHFKNQQ
jgi:hypothetical protein